VAEARAEIERRKAVRARAKESWRRAKFKVIFFHVRYMSDWAADGAEQGQQAAEQAVLTMQREAAELATKQAKQRAAGG
jgi:hypothetical protein